MLSIRKDIDLSKCIDEKKRSSAWKNEICRRVVDVCKQLKNQQWTPYTDDPDEVHQTLSSLCPYVLFILKTRQTSTASILNDNSNNRTLTSNLLRFNKIAQASAFHRAYVEISKRLSSFNSWPQEDLPSVDDLVRAGYFYTGLKTIVTCFYCNGSLQNWGPQDNPLIEHVCWFPLCAYAKQLCDDELYRKVQESKRIRQENDFATDCDLFIACIILQKQIDHINGREENIIVPKSLSSTPISNEPFSSNSSNTNKITETTSTIATIDHQSKTETKTSSKTDLASSNLCILCSTKDKRLACIPCGYLATCVPCGHTLRTCSICRQEIEAFVRIYI
ncbi:unnamed protein product [Rotaria sp. Silwood2]|nr:unnamed protein product [Rotaria sp. Silwood2]CAF2973359.1 unnamed protein product [Rotaria sp. Silwood2]